MRARQMPGDIDSLKEVLGDETPDEKRRARLMLAVLNELECCDLAGEPLTHGLYVTFSAGSQWEFMVQRIATAQM